MHTCFLNGKFIPENEANISVFDRGFLFSDGVYEVSAVFNGRLVDNGGHLARLSNSLKEIGISAPYSTEEIIVLQKQLIEKNNIKNGAIYLQVTRGTENVRNFLPKKDTTPTFLLIPQHKDLTDNPLAERGAKILTVPDIRWAKRHIKAIGLLGAVLAKQAAEEAGCDDAWFVENGYVTEGSSNNVFFIKDKTLVTKKPNTQILNGITRQTILRIADRFNLTVEERDFTVAEAQGADEVFISSATMLIVPVICIDDCIVGNGLPGPLARTIRQTYIEMAQDNLLP
ncbi:MAG: D-amino-acid transaminase [Gammaproteobacteria bacterium]|nr:D-amino-acid transaminase [Gammaproteobacteria bacterium]